MIRTVTQLKHLALVGRDVFTMAPLSERVAITTASGGAPGDV